MQLDLAFLSEPRFSQPANWRWHSFRSSTGHKIRFGSVFPKDKIPDAVIVCLPGFREFSEKYFEIAQDMLNRNFGFWVIDWAGQGGSDRLLSDQFKVHSIGFDKNIEDLKQFIFDYVKPAAVHPDVGRLPVILLGHSMGAHIGLRYLHDNPDDFVGAAAFSAPLIRIRQFASYHPRLARIFSGLMKLMPTAYIPGGEKAAELARLIPPGKGWYSSDPVRDRLHTAWFEKDARLQVKGPTYAWLAEVLRSCDILQSKRYLKGIKPPVLIATAGKDFIVSSKATQDLVKNLPAGELLDLPNAQHEILMEKDEIRNVFLARFDEFVQKHILSKHDRMRKF